jgi:hypothetical protein
MTQATTQTKPTTQAKPEAGSCSTDKMKTEKSGSCGSSTSKDKGSCGG